MITKWTRSDILLDGRGSEQPGNAKISSEAEQGCKARFAFAEGTPGSVGVQSRGQIE